MACAEPLYRPRDAEHTVLHQVVEHLEAFLRAAVAAGDGVGLPQFVEREFRFLMCGVFEAGVARFRCEGCAREHLVPFSCKGRGFCPSCGGRRMTERAAHLVGAVLPRVPVRQLGPHGVPYRLWYRMARDHGLSRAGRRIWSLPDLPQSSAAQSHPAIRSEHDLAAIGHDVTVREDNLGDGDGQFARPSGISVDEATGELRAGVFHLTPATAISVPTIDDRSCCCSARRRFPISAAPLMGAHASSWTHRGRRSP